MNIKITITILAVIFLSGAYSFYYHDRPRVDAAGYDSIGWNIARGYGYIEDVANRGNPARDWAINRIGPGYEFFLAGLYMLFGHTYWVVWIVHALLRGLSTILVYRMTLMLFPGRERIAFGAAILFGFSPDLVLVNGLLLTETLFLFLLLLAIYSALQYCATPSPTYAFIGGLFFAFALLTRPVIVAPLLLTFWVLIQRNAWKSVFAFILLPALIVGSWSYYATTLYGRFILTTGVGGYDLWVGNNPQARGGFEKAPEVQEARRMLSMRELDLISRAKYFEFLIEHPFQFLELQIRKVALYFSLLRPTGYWPHVLAHKGHLFPTALVSFLWTAVLFIAGGAGAFLLLRERHKTKASLFLLFAVLQPLTVIPVIVETRYRYPLYPFLAIFAAYFLAHRPLPRREALIAVACLALATGYDIVSYSADIISKVRSIL